MSTRDSLELFSGNPFRQSLFHLVLCHMDKQVGYIENGVAVFQSDIDIHFFTVFCEYHADERQRNAGPLVFLNPAVVVGTEVHNAVLFMNRIGFQIQTGRINMGSHDFDAFMDRFFPNHRQNNGFIFLVPIYLVSRFERLHGIDRFKSLFFRTADNFRCRQSFRACRIKERLVFFTVCHGGLALTGIHPLPNGFASAVCFFHFCLLKENYFHIGTV